MASPSYPRRLWRALALLGLILLVVLAASTWVLPHWLHGRLPEWLGQALGRPVSLQAVTWRPWTLTLDLQGLQVGALAGGAEPRPALLQVTSAQARLSPQSLWHLQAVLATVQIDGLRVHVVRTPDGQLDVQDILRRLSAAAPATDKPTQPASFAIQALSLTQGSLQWDDRQVAQVHSLSDINLQLSDLSRLAGDRARPAQATLTGKLQGTAWQLQAQGLPFSPEPQADITLHLDPLAWQPYLAYLPKSLPVRIQQGQLALDAKVQLRQRSGQPSMSASGQLLLRDVAIDQADGQPLARWAALTVPVSQLQWPAQKLELGDVRWDGLAVQLRRDAQGRLAGLASAGSGPAAPLAAASPATPAVPGWQLSLAALQINQAHLDWQDQTAPGVGRASVSDLQLQLRELRWPAAAPWAVDLQARVGAPGAAGGAMAALKVSGQAHTRLAKLSWQFDDLDLALGNPYLASHLLPRLSGRASAQGQLAWSAGETVELAIQDTQLRLRDVRWQPPSQGAEAAPAWSLDSLEAGPLSVDIPRQQVAVAQLKLSRPKLDLSRDAQGLLNVQTWLIPAPSKAVPSPTLRAGGAWRLKLDRLQWDGGQMQWRDAAVQTGRVGQPLALKLQALTGQVQALAWPPAPGVPVHWPMEWSAQLAMAPPLAGPAPPPAQLGWSGKLLPDPLQWDGQLRVQQWPVHRLAGYLGDVLPVRLRHAEVSYQGSVRGMMARAGLSLSAKGQMRLSDWRIQARPGAQAADDSGDELLSWQSLALQGLDFSLAPAKRPTLAIQALTLDDFFARLLITEQGRFNLASVADAQAAANPNTAGGAAAAPGMSSSASVSPPPAEGATLPLDLSIGRTQIRNGRVDFTDHFIQPHYSAQLSDLQGELGKLDSQARDMAPVQIKGRVAETALLAVEGRSNPFVSPPALDVKAHVTELELAPLTPYAIKYAGYGIERGKLSVNLGYKVDDSGRLDAGNQIILNQLTFGDRVDSPTATSLPVRLAVALLKDRNGVIDVNLPVSGSLQDPQFSVGGIVFKLVVNLVGKALTAPFSLLAGSDTGDLSQVEFLAGSSTPTAAGRAALSKVAQALIDRPALAMTVMGVADPLAERDGLARALLEDRLRTEHRRLQLRAAPMQVDGPVPAAAEALVTPAERAALLQRLYRQTPLPDKPRNLIGLAIDVPAEEAERRLLAATRIHEDQARQLALQRGLAVRDALVALGLPSNRLFLAAPKVRASGEDDSVWLPRVELTLSHP